MTDLKYLTRAGAASLLLVFAHPGTTVSMTQVSGDKQVAANRSAREQRLHAALTTLLTENGIPAPRHADAVAASIQRASQAYGIPDSMLMAMIHQESRFEVSALSPAGAVGLAQVLPATAIAMDRSGLAPGKPDRLAEPATSVLFGAAFVAHLRRQYRSWEATFTVYNMGPGNYENHLAMGETTNGYALAVVSTEARWDAYLDGHGRMPLSGQH